MSIISNLRLFLLSKSLATEVPGLLADFMSPAQTCVICNGYYGPCYGEQLCATCHAFLYPEQIHQSHFNSTAKFLDNKSDSDDSGNEDLGPMGPATSGPFGSDDVQLASGTEDCDVDMVNDGSGPPSPEHENHNGAVFGQGMLQELILALSSPRHFRDVVAFGTMEKLPSEVLSKVFNNLDDLSRFCCSQVCKRWLNIVKSDSTATRWEKYVKDRWPLYHPLFAPVCWFNVYRNLVASAPCLKCLYQPGVVSGHHPCFSQMGSKRIISELKTLQAEKIQGIEAKPLDRACSQFAASILGPVGTPYEGGKFFLYIRISAAYPMHAPIVRFITKIFHPNVGSHGDIGLDVLLHNWCPSLTLGKVLLSIQSILNDPDILVPMRADVAKLFTERREIYDAIARACTWKYAMSETNIV